MNPTQKRQPERRWSGAAGLGEGQQNELPVEETWERTRYNLRVHLQAGLARLLSSSGDAPDSLSQKGDCNAAAFHSVQCNPSS